MIRAILMSAPGVLLRTLDYRDIAKPQVSAMTRTSRLQLGQRGVNPIDIRLRKRGLFYPEALPVLHWIAMARVSWLKRVKL